MNLLHLLGLGVDPAAQAPPGPTGANQSNCQRTQYGPKFYVDIKISYEDAIADGYTEVLTGSSPDVKYAFVTADRDGVRRIPATGVGDPHTTGWIGTWLIQPGATPRWCWVRHTDSRGVQSAAVAVDGAFPYQPKNGCLL